MLISHDKRSPYRKNLNKRYVRKSLCSVPAPQNPLAITTRQIVGILSISSSGNAFCTQADGKRLFVSSYNLAGAMQDDRVRVKVTSTNGKLKGQVTEILERRRPNVVGFLLKNSKGALVTPINAKLHQQILIPSQGLNGAEGGCYVLVQVSPFLSKGRLPIGQVKHVFGKPGDSELDRELIISEYNLPRQFSDYAQQEAKGLPEITSMEIARRVDLRGEAVFTIDGESTKDFDDAISIKLLENNNYQLGVHIADVSFYVRPGSALNQEAYRRGTSVYFADGYVIPMLPPHLSDNLCSLQPRKDRLALSCLLELGRDGTIVKTRLFESVIRSQARLTYTQVDQILTGKAELESPVILNSLKVMSSLAKQLRDRRFTEGSLELNLPEAKPVFDGNGQVVGIERTKVGFAHNLIEEFMLVANRAVAEWLGDSQCIYRIQPEPEPQEMEALRTYLEYKGYRWENNKSRLSGVLRGVLNQAIERGEEDLIKHLLRCLNGRAKYSTQLQAHFNLNFERYSHFTSPIRRYADLCVHRLVKARLRGSASGGDRLYEIANQCTLAATRAESAERTYLNWKKLEFLSNKTGQTFNGYVYNIDSSGVFVTLPEAGISGLVHKTRLPGDVYVYDPHRRAFVGQTKPNQFGLGQMLKVRLEGINPVKRQMTLVPSSS